MRLLLITTLALVLAAALTACGNSRGDGGWWHYGFSGSSPFWEQLHLYDADPTRDQRLVVVITVFADEKTAVHHVLERDGTGMIQRGESKTGVRRTPDQVAQATFLLQGIAPGGTYPPIARLVIIRWHQDGNAWVTATFDRDDLPVRVQNLAMAVTGQAIGDITP